MKTWVVLIAALFSVDGRSQSLTLSPEAEVSVITCGPGQEEVYTAFGHSAIRIVDPVNQINYAYNYGVFDFAQPNFYLNYTRGLLMFKLGVYDYADFVNSYSYYNRWITEQVLDLSPQQKQDVFNFLERNALPENESYRYDYFYNNCANKVRDVFAEVLKDSIRFDQSFITTNYTIRQLTDLYLVHQPWGDLGIDICLGLPIDKVATPYEYMYLPDYVSSSFDHASIIRNGALRPLVKRAVPVFVGVPKEVPRAIIHPWEAMGAFLAIAMGLSLFDWIRKRPSLWFDVILFGALGAIGTLLLVLWTATDHAAAANNFNLLWAMPFHVVVFAVISKEARPFLRKYFLGTAVLLVLTLLLWAYLPQQLNVFLLPFVAGVTLRAIVLARWLT